MTIKAVIDTNVTISGLYSRKGNTWLIVNAWAVRSFRSILSTELVAELLATLQKPHLKKFMDESVPGIVNSLVLKADFAEIAKTFQVCSDPDDDALFNAAYAGRADFIVSGDKAVLEIKTFKGIKIITPALFVEKLRL
jgi:uncharacterized protein